MAKVYATLILNGKRKFSAIPANLKADVDALLVKAVEDGEISQDEYEELISQ